MITKEKFVEIIRRLKATEKLQNDINFLINKTNGLVENEFINGYGIVLDHQDIVISLLEEMFNDSNENISYISWWVFDTNYGEKYSQIYKEGKLIKDIKTPEDLYDYLREKDL